MYELCDSEEQLLVDSISFMSNSLSHVSKYFEAKLKYCILLLRTFYILILFYKKAYLRRLGSTKLNTVWSIFLFQRNRYKVGYCRLRVVFVVERIKEDLLLPIYTKLSWIICNPKIEQKDWCKITIVFF